MDEPSVAVYCCLHCGSKYRGDFVEHYGKRVCTWDGNSLVPYEPSYREIRNAMPSKGLKEPNRADLS